MLGLGSFRFYSYGSGLFWGQAPGPWAVGFRFRIWGSGGSTAFYGVWFGVVSLGFQVFLGYTPWGPFRLYSLGSSGYLFGLLGVL